jgi:hypothetical protein
MSFTLGRPPAAAGFAAAGFAAADFIAVAGSIAAAGSAADVSGPADSAADGSSDGAGFEPPPAFSARAAARISATDIFLRSAIDTPHPEP